MDFPQALALVTVLLQVTFLEGVLSLDNAAVLGAVVLSLPHDLPVPWPRGLQALGRVLAPVLGKQRTAALRVGLIGAYLGRGLMLVMASFVIRNPWLQLIGAAYLLKIAVAELGSNGNAGEAEDEGESDMLERARARGFWGTVLMVELMDLAFSLDNVVVVVSLSSDLWLVMAGVAIGILTMRFAAGFFTTLIEKIPSLSTAAYLLVFNIGLEFIFARIFHTEIPQFARFSINIGTLLLAVVYNQFPFFQVLLRGPFRVFRWLFHLLDRVFYYVLFPLGWVLSKVFGLLALPFRSRAKEAETSHVND